MQRYKLIYFKDCPNFPEAAALLEQLGLAYDAVCQDELAAGDPLRDYASPTLLAGDEIIFGSRASGGGCSVSLPSLAELRAKINETAS